MTSISLPPRCDRAVAKAMHPEFVALLGCERVQVDASAVEQIGLAMLQLLSSARLSFADLHFIPSPAFLEAARMAGLESHLFDGETA